MTHYLTFTLHHQKVKGSGRTSAGTQAKQTQVPSTAASTMDDDVLCHDTKVLIPRSIKLIIVTYLIRDLVYVQVQGENVHYTQTNLPNERRNESPN